MNRQTPNYSRGNNVAYVLTPLARDFRSFWHPNGPTEAFSAGYGEGMERAAGHFSTIIAGVREFDSKSCMFDGGEELATHNLYSCV